MGAWPDSVWFLRNLDRRPTEAYLRALARYCVGTLVTQSYIKPEVRRALEDIGLAAETGTPHSGPWEIF